MFLFISTIMPGEKLLMQKTPGYKPPPGYKPILQVISLLKKGVERYQPMAYKRDFMGYKKH